MEDCRVCPRCLVLAQDGKIHPEMIQSLPKLCPPRARDGSGPCCYDCASAETVMRVTKPVLTFEMARVAVGNDRREQYRLPGALLGLVHAGLMRPSQPGDLERQYDWLDANDWFGLSEDD